MPCFKMDNHKTPAVMFLELFFRFFNASFFKNLIGMKSIQKHLRQLLQMGAGPRCAIGNVSGYRCVSDCRSRGHEFDPGPVPYFCGD